MLAMMVEGGMINVVMLVVDWECGSDEKTEYSKQWVLRSCELKVECIQEAID